MATVGYMEGTDPLLLTRLVVKGIGTLPLSNGFDLHGKHLNHISSQDDVDVVVGYLHKVIPTADMALLPMNLLLGCLSHNIPVLLIVERDCFEDAHRRLGQVGDQIRLVDPADVYNEVMRIISD